MKHSCRKCVVVASIVLMAMVLAVGAASFWRSAGWLRKDEAWVLIPASGMQELHTTDRVYWVVRGRMEAVRSQSLSAVIPLGSTATNEPRHEAHWLWQPAEPTRVRSWDDRWHISSWDEWRLGDYGWYETTGGGAQSRVLSIPIWMVLLLAGTPCWISLAPGARARRRRRQGRCVACGYQRRGLPPGAVCPECGSAAG